MVDDHFIAWNNTIMLHPSIQWLSKRVDKEIDWASFEYILDSNYFVFEDTNRNCEAIPKRLEISLLKKLYLKCVQASRIINPPLCCKPCRLEVIKLHPFANESVPIQCGRKSITHLSENVCNQKEFNCFVFLNCFAKSHFHFSLKFCKLNLYLYLNTLECYAFSFIMLYNNFQQ